MGAYTLDFDTLDKTTSLPDSVVHSFDKDNPDVVGILSTR